jgi:hypothetical protein
MEVFHVVRRDCDSYPRASHHLIRHGAGGVYQEMQSSVGALHDEASGQHHAYI